MAERWTMERRREHTRQLLLDAAEQVFTRRGFEGASLDEIADEAGYTRGAIYKHFVGKEELFLAVNKRFNERFLAGFLDLIDPARSIQDYDVAELSSRWHALQPRDPAGYVLGMEFMLYVLRNPQVRPEVARQRREITDMIARFIEAQAVQMGATLKLPAATLARIAYAASAGLEVANVIDEGEEDLYAPFLSLLLSAWDTVPQPPPVRPRRVRGARPTGDNGRAVHGHGGGSSR